MISVDKAMLAKRELRLIRLQREGRTAAARTAARELKQLRLHREGARCRTCGRLFDAGNKLCPVVTTGDALAPWREIKEYAAGYVCTDYVRCAGWNGW